MQGLKARMAQLVPEKQAEVKAFRKEFGGRSLGEVTVEQVGRLIIFVNCSESTQIVQGRLLFYFRTARWSWQLPVAVVWYPNQ